MSSAYRTAGSAANSRFEYWRSLMRQHFALSSGSAGDARDFEAELTVNPLGPVTVMSMVAPLQRWTRTHRHLRSDPHDEFVLTLMLSGSGSLEQEGRQALQGAGVISLFDTSKRYTYTQCGETLCVEIPRQYLLQRLTVPVPLALAYSAQSPIGSLIQDVALAARQRPLSPTPASGEWVGSALVDLVAALLESGMPGTAPSSIAVPGTPLERVRLYIAENLGDPALSVERIARANALSPRTLTRMFVAEGTTPMRWVWQERLAASHRVLLGSGARSVTDVAFAHGFSGLSHFSRSFKQRYGMTPHELVTAGAQRSG